MLAEEGNFAALARINRERSGRVEAIDSPEPVVLDMDCTEIPVYGEQEQSAYNGHFESRCYHPLLVFHREGDCLAAEPGGVCTSPPRSPSFDARAARRRQERPIRGGSKAGGAQRTMWALTLVGGVYVPLVGESKMEIPIRLAGGSPFG